MFLNLNLLNWELHMQAIYIDKKEFCAQLVQKNLVVNGFCLFHSLVTIVGNMSLGKSRE